MIITTYLRASYTLNKKLKRNFDLNNKNNHDIKNCQKCLVEKEKKNNKSLNYSYKPLRTHHCSICKECALKMDHHCPFLGNCVGLINYRYYFQLIFFGVIAFSIMLIVYSYTAYFYLKKIEGGKYFIIFCYVFWIFICFFILLGLIGNFCLFKQHFDYILSNSGTIEHMKHEGDKYDFGNISNLKKIFGGIFYFFFPIKINYKYEGYHFPMQAVDPEITDIPFLNYRYSLGSFEDRIYEIDDLIIKLSIKREEGEDLVKNTYIFGNYKFELDE